MVKWSEEEIVENIFKKYKGKKHRPAGCRLVRGRKGHIPGII
jgi:excinuclease ABC subunit A